MLRATVLLLACAALTQGGVRSNQRIFGGTKATLGEFPWQVSLHYTGNHIFFCGGAILDEWHIVTAASCATPDDPELVHEVISGTLDISPVGLQNGTITYSEEFILYDYTIIGGRFRDNIAIWKLRNPLELDGVYRAAIKLLPQDTPLEVGALAQVAGWGFTEYGGSTTSTDLLRVDVNIQDFGWCQDLYSGNLGPNTICAVHDDGGRDTCDGDTGGALSINGALVGIVDFNNYCGLLDDHPGVYTVAAKYTDWITSVSGVKPSV